MRPAADPSAASDGVDETWIHVQLSPSADPKAVAEAAKLLPNVLADARQVAVDSAALNATLVGLANALDADRTGHFPGYDRRDVAALLRWLADGHFVLLGYQRCSVQRRPGDGRPASRLGVLRLRTDVLAAADRRRRSAGAGAGHHAELPSLRRLPVHRGGPREHRRRRSAIEHRFVGLFTVAATNANVLEIPLISRRVDEALALVAGRPQPSRSADARHHPDHSAFRALRAQRAASCSPWPRRSSISVRDVARCCSCGPTSSRTSCPAWCTCRATATPPSVRLEMQDILVRELGGDQHRVHRPGQRITLGGSAFHRSAARRRRRRPDVDTSLENETRIQNLLTEAARTWGDRLIGAVKSGSISQADAEHYAAAFPEVYKQAFTPLDAIGDIAIIEELQDDSVKLVFAEGGDGETRAAHLVSGRPVGVAERAAADAAVDGRRRARGASVHRDAGRRHAGVDLPVQDLTRSSRFRMGRTPRSASGDRHPVRRRGHRDLAGPRRDRPVQRVGAARRV